MKCFTLLMVAVTCCWTTWVRSQATDKCLPANATSMQFSVTSRLNQTGHWIYQVDLQHEKKEEHRPWTVAVEQSKVDCAGVEHMRTITTITAPAARAGPGYELHPGIGYYKLHTVKKTWQEAKEICASEGGHLAIINSEAENTVLSGMMSRILTENLWVFLGFHDIYQEGNFITIFDEPLSATGFTRWCISQPDNAGGKEHCGSIRTINCGLNDFPCTFASPFFCEQQLY